MDDVMLEQSVTLLKAMAHPCRLRLLLALAGGRVCDVTTLVYLSGLPQPYVSQQLRILRENSLVTCEKRGQHTCYQLAEPQVARLWAVIAALTCGIGHDERTVAADNESQPPTRRLRSPAPRQPDRADG